MKKNIEPYFIRLRDAPFYLGMDKNRFNAEVRPTLHNIPIGKKGIGFERNELDAWAKHYKVLHARLPQQALCNKNSCPVCSTVVPITSAKKITDKQFTEILAAMSKGKGNKP